MTTCKRWATPWSNGIGKLIPLLLAPLVASGCARRDTKPPDAASFALPPASSQKATAASPAHTATANTDKSTTTSIAPPNWMELAGIWLKAALQKSTSQATVQTVRPRAVSINLVALASRHPAWQLADALQREQAVLPSFSPVAVPGLPDLQGALTGIPRTAEPTTSAAGASESIASGVSRSFFRPELRVVASGFSELEANAQQRQEQSLATFMRNAATTQNASVELRRVSLEAGLEEEIEASQRLELAQLEPASLPDPIQLEMTNLRLQLLENVYTTDAERSAAVERLRFLEAQWSAKLKQQESERLAELARLRNEMPQRLRAEGATRINAELDAARGRYHAAREAVAEAQRARIAQDFTVEANPLSIILPSAVLPSQKLAARRGAVASERGHNIAPGRDRIIETLRSLPASTGGLDWQPGTQSFVGHRVASRRTAWIHALRAIALSDTKRWAQVAVRRGGWKWSADARGQAKAVSKPDRTREIGHSLGFY